MNKAKLILLVSVVLMIFAAACTKYNAPTGDVVETPVINEDNKEDISIDDILAEIEETPTAEETEDESNTEGLPGEEKEAAEELGRIEEELSSNETEDAVEETEGTVKEAEKAVEETEKSLEELESDADVVAYEGELIDLKKYVEGK